MIHNLLELLISRSLDNDQPLPRWLKRRVGRDAQLQQFYDRVQRVHVSLRWSANQQREHLRTITAEDISPNESPTYAIAPALLNTRLNARRWAQVGVAIAASLLAIVLFSRSQENVADVARIELLGQQLGAVPTDMLEWLNRGVESSQSQVARYATTVHVSLAGLASWQPMRRELAASHALQLNILDASWQRLSGRLTWSKAWHDDTQSPLVD